jgi:hypothetical protein
MQIAFDCADPAALAAFWVQALPGYQVQPPPAGFDSWEAFLQKNRVHLDLHAGGGPAVPVEEQRANVRSEVARLQAHGATVVEEREELGVAWAVMTDPEGNELCA